MYVLDADGNLVNASTVASILRSAYSDEQAKLFKKYGVVDGDPRTSVRRYRQSGNLFSAAFHLDFILHKLLY